MSAVRGRTYRVQIDVFAEEYVTILDSGDFLLEDAVTGDPVIVDRDKLAQYALSDPPYTAQIADCIRRELESVVHDDCDWPWTEHPTGGWWYREGRCPVCGRT